jgi:sterol desaturase/sphingolipid hydroxylase (fatty acid hydroxylase superfamily)
MSTMTLTVNGPELLRAGVFASLIVALVGCELVWPRRPVSGGWVRRARNVAMIAVATLGWRIVYPLGTIGFAAWWPWGLLHVVRLPAPIGIAVSIVVLDFAIYWQHRAFHASNLLWRFHRVHHSDTGFDATLGVRFHPVEIWLSLGYKVLVIAALGASAAAVAIYESALLAFSLFSHANLALPGAADRVVRRVFITPDWHRVHHSIHAEETNSNFGNILSAWDRWFGTAREQPRDGHESMRIGLAGFRDPAAQRLAALLILQPLASDASIASADASTE